RVNSYTWMILPITATKTEIRSTNRAPYKKFMYTCGSIFGPLSSVAATAAVPPVAAAGAAVAAVSVAAAAVSATAVVVSSAATAAVSTACAIVSTVCAAVAVSCENARFASPIPTMNASTITALNLLLSIKPISYYNDYPYLVFRINITLVVFKLL